MSGCVDIVVVNWNSGGLLRQCLETIAATPADVQSLSQVIVVDNASRDTSAAVTDLSSKLPLTILSNTANKGFAAACNQGAAAGRGQCILFLNTDVVVAPGTIAAAADFLTEGKRERIGIVGIQVRDHDGAVEGNTARFPTPWRLFAQSAGLDRVIPSLALLDKTRNHHTTGDVEQVSGAFLMIHRDLFTELNGFDERFFVYYEEVDLCFRAARSGWRRVHFAGASAMHSGGGSTRSVKDVRLFYLLRSRLLYADKHFGPIGKASVVASTLVVEPLARAVLLGLSRTWADLAALARGYRLLYRSLPTLHDSVKRAQPVKAA